MSALQKAENTGNEPFIQAVKDLEEFKKQQITISQDDQLKLYGLFKVAINEQVAKPGMFNLQDGYKYKAWMKVVDEGKSAKEAQDAYVELVKEIKSKTTS
ncbi:acyl-CoA-binding protein (ACBP)/diazepam binding inhibitor (DBI)/endozepine (EP) [Conoideocrella luteorostrata]|uniref:Acyl-CoA-binding protein (ACBP)/diazepam binding inhibitor (DBI)/endozepine (EP) n=1 Tax=Conoideocrella luteorostrata TaxID=1105319 RepID=A0AAJ0FV08_9HYPO|nr:acyl-CoA-binding protein (ACBP)/diazepam binding inhibitor (DBI)/endozepine (EP) [Conoideocrella luteorostrata]